MNELEVEEFLSHYGVPGMKWGVRKSRSDRTPEEAAARSSRNKKVAKGVGVAVVATGAAFAAYKINQSSSTKISSLPKVNNVGLFGSKSTATMPKSFWSTKDLGKKAAPPPGMFGSPAKMSDFGKTKVSDLPKISAKAGPLGPNMRTELRRERARRNQEITTQLRGWYNESNTPMKDRWYPDVNGIK